MLVVTLQFLPSSANLFHQMLGETTTPGLHVCADFRSGEVTASSVADSHSVARRDVPWCCVVHVDVHLRLASRLADLVEIDERRVQETWLRRTDMLQGIVGRQRLVGLWVFDGWDVRRQWI